MDKASMPSSPLRALHLGPLFLPESVPGLMLSANYINMQIDNRLVRITSGALGGILANYFATGTSPYLGNLVQSG